MEEWDERDAHHSEICEIDKVIEDVITSCSEADGAVNEWYNRWRSLDGEDYCYATCFELLDRWDRYARCGQKDTPLGFIMRKYCCSVEYVGAHEYYILVVPLGSGFFLADVFDSLDMSPDGGWFSEYNLMSYCSAGFTDSEFNSDKGPKVDVLYALGCGAASESAIEKMISREYGNGEETRNYSKNIRGYETFDGPIYDFIDRKYTPLGVGTILREVWVGRIEQEYFVRMINDMREHVSTTKAL